MPGARGGSNDEAILGYLHGRVGRSGIRSLGLRAAGKRSSSFKGLLVAIYYGDSGRI
jgi:hypothetical protein